MNRCICTLSTVSTILVILVVIMNTHSILSMVLMLQLLLLRTVVLTNISCNRCSCDLYVFLNLGQNLFLILFLFFLFTTILGVFNSFYVFSTIAGYWKTSAMVICFIGLCTRVEEKQTHTCQMGLYHMTRVCLFFFFSYGWHIYLFIFISIETVPDKKKT